MEKEIILAINLLKEAGIKVSKQAYGFSIQHVDSSEHNFGECGMDSDSSITLSLHQDIDTPVVWFARVDFIEMANFIISAYKATTGSSPSRKEIIDSMRQLDKRYDDTELLKMIDQYVSEIENRKN